MYFELAIGLLIPVVVPITLILINIWENGPVWEDKPNPKETLGIDLQDAELRDIYSLTKQEIFTLFQGLDAVKETELEDYYWGDIPPVGILYPVFRLYINHFFGPGRWIGQSFIPKRDRIVGYNLFKHGELTSKTRKMHVKFESSSIDQRASTTLHHNLPTNTILTKSLRGEIRKINQNILLGMWITPWLIGPKNPVPFVLLRR